MTQRQALPGSRELATRLWPQPIPLSRTLRAIAASAALLAAARGSAQPSAPVVTLPPPAPQVSGNAPQQQPPFGYLTAGKLADDCSGSSAYAMSYCYAYLAGVHDVMRAYEVWLAQREFCPPGELTQKDLRNVFTTFMKANPDFRDAQGGSAAVVALRRAYPCSRTQP